MKLRTKSLVKETSVGSSSPTKAPRIISEAAVLHDKVNLYVLPFLGLAALLGLLGIVDGMLTTYMLTAYILIDILWVIIQPSCVPSMPWLIIYHHLVTLVLLYFPLKYPHLATYTNWDGLVELNTFFLIARRQIKQMRSISGKLFWATFVPTRLIIHPCLVPIFWKATENHPTVERILLVLAQVHLCAFNLVFLQRGIQQIRRERERLNAYAG